ncbi:transcriptional regulator, TetR family [Marinobacter sp. LV10R510-11A]|uniref:TetR/AcrR family transcriptional regulator n=1 Tax=Marinobacter sp. LV10R510-11A TaxID=1415568 RepID=UPI000BB6EEF4|nr:TetR/AcrR family transcriptional regulator [Marinobacter sp. LV10R510-11A]SOB77494.1 transcriptional regulator, TetR family [Marinobacter sp. LV10R510-11A]
MNRHQDTCQHLLNTGREILAERGFSSVGLSNILQQAGVPKGSFYHYFKSKESFGEAVLEDYFVSYMENLEARFSDDTQPALDRLMSYWQHWQQQYCGPAGLKDCLVVKLSAEVADLSEAMRLTLRDGTDRIIDSIILCVEAAIAEGALRDQNARQLATSLYQLWLGASLLTKLHRDDQHMMHAMAFTRELIKG